MNRTNLQELVDRSDGKFLDSPFRLMRQPIVSTVDPSHIVSHEITLQPLSGPPVLELIQVARAMGCSVDFDMHVVEALERLAHHVDALRVPVWVNLLPSTLLCTSAVKLLCRISEVLQGKLFFEVTEGELIADYSAAMRSLDLFRQAGAGIVLDDFGAGASSIRTMLELQFDAIKIDSKVFQLCASDPVHYGLIEAICESAHSQSAVVVAEGIESQLYAEIACLLGVDMMQGYHIAYPEALHAEVVDGHRMHAGNSGAGSHFAADKTAPNLEPLRWAFPPSARGR